jgi:hypothetical protein
MGKSAMTHSLLADDYKIARSRLRESPDREVVANKDGKNATGRETEARPVTAVILAMPTVPARSWFRSQLNWLVGWMKGCADNYAAAAAYENLSRLSDAELRHRSLHRDVLARDLSKW